MHLTLLDTTCVVNDGQHHAFTSIAKWQDGWYLTHRTAASHAITPPGSVCIWKSPDTHTWAQPLVLSMPNMDLRDPRLCASPEAIYLICGAYTPRYPSMELRPYSTQNLLQSYVTYTEDGRQWAPLQPLFRPGYWIWSALALGERRSGIWVAAAYHTGSTTETSSIHLLSGHSLLDLGPLAMIYDGGNVTKDSGDWRYAHTSPSEPVLYQASPGYLACCVRTETHCEIGVAHAPYQDFRWWPTTSHIHPSAMYPVGNQWLLAGRALLDAGMVNKRQRYDTYTCLWPVSAQTIDTDAALVLPSSGDTGYAGLCAGDREGEVLVSYYSQHLTGKRFGSTLPGSGVFVARVTVDK